MPHSAKDIAKSFLTLTNPDYDDYLSNLKLQKLLYYAQGLHLSLYHKPLFQEDILAWQYGPVVPEVYREYRDYRGAIPVPENFSNDYLQKEEFDLIQEVYQVFGQFSAFKLVEMTHNEPPWKTTSINGVISHQKLAGYFLTLVKD